MARYRQPNPFQLGGAFAPRRKRVHVKAHRRCKKRKVCHKVRRCKRVRGHYRQGALASLGL